MKTTSIILTSTIALLALPLHAAVLTGDVIGTTETDIRSVLEKNGYVVESIEMEEDEIEVEVSLSGNDFEIEISTSTGTVLKIESDADDD